MKNGLILRNPTTYNYDERRDFRKGTLAIYVNLLDDIEEKRSSKLAITSELIFNNLKPYLGDMFTVEDLRRMEKERYEVSDADFNGLLLEKLILLIDSHYMTYNEIFEEVVKKLNKY